MREIIDWDDSGRTAGILFEEEKERLDIDVDGRTDIVGFFWRRV
eukprot:SAG31_NODE_2837_length_5017_cov_3.496543_3_plen_44_part_00